MGKHALASIYTRQMKSTTGNLTRVMVLINTQVLQFLPSTQKNVVSQMETTYYPVRAAKTRDGLIVLLR